MLQIILAILAFGVLVIVHEFGHFITAKRGGVQVNEFWIGMGPTLLKHEHKGTLYCLKLLPFGGACVMEGEDGESENEHAFGKAKLPRRMLIVCAGALMNFLVGFLIVLAVMQPNGPNGGYIVSTISEVNPASTAAADGGLEAGDEILKIDGYHILVRTDFDTALARTGSTTHEITVRRNGEKVTLLAVCGKNAVASGIKAGDIIRSIAPIVGGKGGGKPDSAMGGGTDVLKVDDALAAVDDFVAANVKE